MHFLSPPPTLYFIWTTINFGGKEKKELTKKNPPNTKKTKNLLQQDSKYKEKAIYTFYKVIYTFLLSGPVPFTSRLLVIFSTLSQEYFDQNLEILNVFSRPYSTSQNPLNP